MSSIILGIDSSINSTGLCIWDKNKDTNKYYIITSKLTKKMKDFQHKKIEFIFYNKLNVNRLDDYQTRERCKLWNFSQICSKIKEVIEKEGVEEASMEGISYGSVGSAALADLGGLNFMIRYLLYTMNIPLTIFSPTQIKSFATGSGAADKDTMIYTWKKCDPEMQDVTSVKIDDVADSYFIAHMIETCPLR